MRLKLIAALIGVLLAGQSSSAPVFSFAAPTQFATGGYPTAVAIGDVTGDGRPDLVSMNNEWAGFPFTAHVLIREQMANGTLAPAVAVRYGPDNNSTFDNAIELVDLNGDGASEIAVGTTGKLSILTRQTNGSFALSQTTYSGYEKITSLVAMDANLDGHPDLASYAESSGTSVRVFLGDGAGGVSSHYSLDMASGKGLRAVDLGGATGAPSWSNDEANDVGRLRIFGRLLVLALDRQWISTLDISRPATPRAVTTNKNTTTNWIGSVAGNLLFGVGKKIEVAAVPPFVTASLPAAIAGAVPLLGTLPVTFSKPIDPATLTTSPGQLLCGSQMFALSATASIDRLRVVFRSATKLPPSTTCSLSLGDLRDAFGTALSSEGSGPAITFVTAASEPAPLSIPKSA